MKPSSECELHIIYLYRKTYIDDILVTPGECNIPVLDGQTMTNRKFLKEFAYNVPIVIRDATDNSVFRALCQVSYKPT